MASIYLFSGACGCGKSTLAEAFAKQLDRQAYLIHGDSFHAGFVQPEDASIPCLPWADVLRFNWDCILLVARQALMLGLDVVIDYVVEDELSRVQALARDSGAPLHYIVLTASEDTLRTRLQKRGDAWLIERSLFLREKLSAMPENHGHLFDITGVSVAQELRQVHSGQFLMKVY